MFVLRFIVVFLRKDSEYVHSAFTQKSPSLVQMRTQLNTPQLGNARHLAAQEVRLY